MSLARSIVDGLLDVLFPPRCLGCNQAGTPLCAACLATVRPYEGALCPRCGQPQGTNADGAAAAHVVCSACAQGLGPLHLSALRSVAHYDGVVRLAVLALKFRKKRHLAHPLGDLMAAEVLRAGWQPDLIVPIPLHARRQRQRGYNQAELLARACARRLGIPCRVDLLTRVRATPPQVGLDAAARRMNVVDAFALTRPDVARAHLASRRVLLVDDVLTTGSTLDAAAQALALAHPATIWGIAVTRPDLHAANADTSARRDGVSLPLRTAEKRVLAQ